MRLRAHTPHRPARLPPDARQVIAFWLAGGRVLAGMNVNVWDAGDAIQALVRGGRPVDPARLGDPGVPLEELAG
jgi:3-phenylpropionate/trans-cinnamate dioxygenase ferredoxin reductase subunit